MTLVFSSVTYAIKAQRLLAFNHIYTELTRSAAVTAVRGCGYGLRLTDSGKLATALNLLNQNGIVSLASIKE